MPHRTVVVTVTPNPSLDLLFETDHLVWDDANRMADPRRRPGGQGINVARAAAALGGHAVAIALLGGRTGDEIVRVLQAEGTPIRAVPAADETRTFVAVREHARGRSLLLNARGPARPPGDADALRRAVAEELRERTPDWLACCGSLPGGFAPDFYRELALAARAAGSRVVVDCDGEALATAADACDLLVPNQHEAERLTGIRVQEPMDAVAAVRALPAPMAAITLGPNGAVLRAGELVWTAAPQRPVQATAVGAGDCFLAALLLALRQQLEPPDVLRHATAAAAASLLSTDSLLIEKKRAEAMLDQVSVSRAG